MSNENDARTLAERFRGEHGLGHGPIKDMFEIVHVCANIDVLSMDVGDAEHGLSMLDQETRTVVIAVATTSHPMRQRSSIAHELGHVLAGDLVEDRSLVPGERGTEEIRADAFARHFLLPMPALRQRFAPRDGTVTLRRLSDLVQEFEVSPVVAAIQLRSAGSIDAATCAQWSGSQSTQALAASYGWLSQYRSLAENSRRPRAPQTLMRRAVAGYHRGVLSLAEVANWYGTSPDELELGPPTASDLVDEDGDWFSDAPLFPSQGVGPNP